MKTRPLTLTQTEAQAAHEGRLTCVVRVVKPQPPSNYSWSTWFSSDQYKWSESHPLNGGASHIVKCPLGQPGDELWCREAWAYVHHTQNAESGGDDCFWRWDEEMYGPMTPDNLKLNSRFQSGAACLCYKSDGEDGNPSELYPYTDLNDRVIAKAEIPWQSPVTMPRWASRTTLRLESVAVKRVMEVTEEEAIGAGLSSVTKDGTIFKYGIPDSDGLPGNDDHGWAWKHWEADPRKAFEKLFNAQHGPGSYESNCWVWVANVTKV